MVDARGLRMIGAIWGILGNRTGSLSVNMANKTCTIVHKIENICVGLITTAANVFTFIKYGIV